MIAGLPLQADDAVYDSAYAQIALTVQTQVERGLADVDAIAKRAADGLEMH
jgi:hypothetical protein